MHSNEEPNSYFGGMAVPSWNSSGECICDPPEEFSWIFKIEVGENKYLNQLNLILYYIVLTSINGNASKIKKLLLCIQV